MLNKRKILKLCKKLPYTIDGRLDEKVFNNTIQQIKLIISQFGVGESLDVLRSVWPIEKALSFFEMFFTEINTEDAKLSNNNKTIGTYYYRAYNGGVERVHSQLINIWTRLGYRVVLITLEDENELDYPYDNSVKRIVLSKEGGENLKTFQKIIDDEKIDIFIDHAWTNPLVLWKCVLCKMLNVTYLIHDHSHFAIQFQFNMKYACMCNKIYKLADGIVTLSELNAKYYQASGCNAFLVNHPIPTDLINSKHEINHDNKDHLLFVGRLGPEKKPEDLIAILSEVKKIVPEAVLDVYGKNELRSVHKMKRMAKKLGINQSVNFYGFKTYEELNNIYNKYSYLVSTSMIEGYGMTYLEAKAHGLPIVMYELPYLTLVKDKKGVLVAKQGDIKKMAANITELIKSDDLCEKLSIQSYESFQEFLKYDINAAWDFILKKTSGSNDDTLFVDTAIYYNPNESTETERMVIYSLLPMISYGYDNLVKVWIFNILNRLIRNIFFIKI